MTMLSSAAISARPQLRLVVAGSVDDGKSTLVGRLLHDTKSILADQYAALELVSRRRGSDKVDLALLTDGLRAEREQGITIDVAYRYFSTPHRSFVLADTPGHTQYTRNTVTAASTADAALVLVDVRKGVRDQTRRHLAVMAFMHVRHITVAVNKMDSTNWDQKKFDAVAAEVREVTGRLGVQDVTVVPVSAWTGQNIANRGDDPAGDWYVGPTLLAVLEELSSPYYELAQALRMPVQLVLRPRTPEHPDYRGIAGRIMSGMVKVGDTVMALPGGLSSVVSAIDTPTGPAESASAGESVVIQLHDEIDVGRGQVLVQRTEPHPRSTRSIDAAVCWFHDQESTLNQRVLIKAGTKVVQGVLSSIHRHWIVEDACWADSTEPARLNDIVDCRFSLSEPIAVDDYSDMPTTGAFLVIDPETWATIGAGMVGDPLNMVAR